MWVGFRPPIDTDPKINPRHYAITGWLKAEMPATSADRTNGKVMYLKV